MRKLFAAIALSLCALAFSPGAGSAQGVIGVGTMSQGSISFSTGSVIAQMMTERLGLQARVLPNSGETTLIPLLDAGELDFGVANALEAAEAVEGLGGFQGAPMRNLRVAAALFPLRVALFVRADSDIHSIADLRGERVTAGFSAMASITAMLEAVLATGDLTLADVTPVLAPNVVVGADLFTDGRADAFFFAVGAAKVAEVNAAAAVRIVPVADDAAALARMQAIFPEAYVTNVAPAPGLVGVSDATPVMAFDNLLLTNAATPDAVVRAVVAGLAAEKAALTAGFPLFRGLDPAALHKPGLRAPFHPATVAWAAGR
ncbi:MAG: TAXI family TRAP transporter solute-binding subunit [Alphaproteobacteria bacterium]|nr:TAXI family TRAP transporter solute-binding subunit [Alphaproteobacteria bacterium]